MKRLFVLALAIVPFAVGCVTPRGTGSFSVPQVPPVQGTARSEVIADNQIADAAVKAAETYWNAQKTADSALFRSVTPHGSMNVIFDWSYVNKSDVVVESAPLSGIKTHILQFNEHNRKYDFLPKYTDASLSELKAAAAYADSMEKGGYTMLGSLLKKEYWEAIVPNNLADLGSYRLMNMKYIADVKAQSKGGTVLQKRVILQLYRMQADTNDSGWKVLFVEGLHNLPPML